MGSFICCKFVRTMNNNNYINCSKWSWCEMWNESVWSPESISQSYYSICRENYHLWRPLQELHFHLVGYFSLSFICFSFSWLEIFCVCSSSLCFHSVGPMNVHILYYMISVNQAPNNKYETKMKYHDILNLATILKPIFLPNRHLPVRKTIFLFNFDFIHSISFLFTLCHWYITHCYYVWNVDLFEYFFIYFALQKYESELSVVRDCVGMCQEKGKNHFLDWVFFHIFFCVHFRFSL